MHKKKPKILIMAAGTGGHIIPGLSIADYLKTLNKDVEIVWLGTKEGLEQQLVPKEIVMHCISVWGLRNKSFLTKAFAPFRLAYALTQSMFIIRKLKPTLVLGMGGFVCGPGGLAAYILRYPLVLHEQNAVAGFTNKVLAKFATKIYQGFPNSFKFNEKLTSKLNYTGNPLRSEFLIVSKDKQQSERNDANIINILVVGGSRGAIAINNLIPQAVQILFSKPNLKYKYFITHQCGGLNYISTKEHYERLNLQANAQIKVLSYIDKIVDFYKDTDLVICRSGAMTVSEIAATGVPAIFIPFPQAVDDHQTKNAEYLSKNNAAVIMQQNEVTPMQLADKIFELTNSKHNLNEMAGNALQCAKLDASKIIAKELLEFC